MARKSNIDTLLGSLSPVLIPADDNNSDRPADEGTFDLHDHSDLDQLGSRWDEILTNWNSA